MFKSKFEKDLAKVFGKRAVYEPDKFKFIQPAVERTYIPDWKIGEKVYIESKGKLDLDSRKKMVWVKDQYPDYTFYLLFQNAYNRITKRSSTTYGEWATANGFEWAHWPDGIPPDWFKEKNKNGNKTSLPVRGRNRRISSKAK